MADAGRHEKPAPRVDSDCQALATERTELPTAAAKRRGQRETVEPKQLGRLGQGQAELPVEATDVVSPMLRPGARRGRERAQIELGTDPLTKLIRALLRAAGTRCTGKPQSGRLNTDFLGCIPMSGGRGGTRLPARGRLASHVEAGHRLPRRWWQAGAG